MDFVRYSYIVAVAELGSISKAAERCFISQPALTRSINKIEEELGVRLFDRSTSPLRLTYAGERYVAGIKNILTMKYQLDREMEDISALKKGRLTVGIPNTYGPLWLPQVLPVYLQKYPGVNVRIVEGISGELEESLIKERIDLLAVGSLPITLPGIEYEEIAREQLMLVFPSDHPLFGGASYDRDDGMLHFIEAPPLDGQPYVSTLPNQGLYKAAKQMFESFGIKPKVIVETANSSTALYLASEGLGFTIASASSYHSRRFRTRPVFCTLYDPPAERILVAAYKKDRQLPAAARHFIDTLKIRAANSSALKIPRFGVVYDIGSPR